MSTSASEWLKYAIIFGLYPLPAEPTEQKFLCTQDLNYLMTQDFDYIMTQGEPIPVITNPAPKNYIIGGNFDTNPWQRGLSFSNPVTGDFSADMFYYLANTVGSAAFAINRVSSVAPTLEQAGFVCTNVMRLNCNATQIVPSVLALSALAYTVEGIDFAEFAQQDFTFSFWVQTNKTGVFTVAFVNSGNDRSYVATYSVVAGVSQNIKIQVPASPADGGWSYEAGTVGLRVLFTLMAGGSYTTSVVGEWQPGLLVQVAGSSNFFDAINNEINIDLVSIVPTYEVLPFLNRLATEELILCKRYYQKSYAQGTYPTAATYVGATFGYYPNTTKVVYGFQQPLTVTMAGTPTVNWYSPSGAPNNLYEVTSETDLPMTGASDNASDTSTGWPTLVTSPGGVKSFLAHYTAEFRII